MSTLFKLKKWMTLESAANYLSSALAEPVTVPDILQLALDGHLVLSVDFVNGAQGNFGKRVPADEALVSILPSLRMAMETGKKKSGMLELHEQLPPKEDRAACMAWIARNKVHFENGELIATFSGDFLQDGTVLEFESEISDLLGIWDLPMQASEKLDVLHSLQQKINGPEVTGTYLEGVFLVGEDGKTYARLMGRLGDKKNPVEGKPPAYRNPIDYYPIGGLPEDATYVVRTTALNTFLQNVTGINKTLDARERSNLLRIIRALDSMANLAPRGASTSVQRQLEVLGFTRGPGDSTIRKVLQQARALEPDGKPQ